MFVCGVFDTKYKLLLKWGSSETERRWDTTKRERKREKERERRERREKAKERERERERERKSVSPSKEWHQTRVATKG